jgi:hypothetical protein
MAKKKPPPALFAIFIHEEDGKVTVSADYIGLGNLSLELGLGIMNQFHIAEATEPDRFIVRPINSSQYYQ